MRVTVDETLCTGNGRCYVVAQAVYHPDDEGFCLERGTEFTVADSFAADARAGADSCPQGAIEVSADEPGV